jgi:hypothetical protein
MQAESLVRLICRYGVGTFTGELDDFRTQECGYLQSELAGTYLGGLIKK